MTHERRVECYYPEPVLDGDGIPTHERFLVTTWCGDDQDQIGQRIEATQTIDVALNGSGKVPEADLRSAVASAATAMQSRLGIHHKVLTAKIEITAQIEVE